MFLNETVNGTFLKIKFSNFLLLVHSHVTDTDLLEASSLLIRRIY